MSEVRTSAELAPLAVKAEDAAKMFQVGTSTWWNWVKNGKAPQPVKIGGATRWRVSDLQQLLATGPTRS